MIHRDHPNEIVVACNGSPLNIGLGQNKTYIASETSAFSKYTKNYIALKDGEIGVVRANQQNLDLSRVEVAPEHEIQLTPHPYPHFTLKECLEQPEAIARALSFGGRMNGGKVVLGGLDSNAALLATIHNMTLTGCGTSKYAAEFGAKIMRDLDCFDSVNVMDSAEVCDYSLFFALKLIQFILYYLFCFSRYVEAIFPSAVVEFLLFLSRVKRRMCFEQ